MLDFSTYPKKDKFLFWFLMSPVSGRYEVYDMLSTEKVGDMSVEGDFTEHPEWEESYKLYLQRPESYVGRPVPEDKFHDAETYENLIVGLLAIKSKEMCPDLEAASARYSACISWLESTDFFFAPASTVYHESFPHGLLEHSFKVYNQILDLRNVEKFKNVSLISAAMCALVHDWCKIGNYESYNKNVKDETTGKWHQEDAYKFNMRGVPLGHGVTSMLIAPRFFGLTTDEALAIRWHMSYCRVCESEINELQLANEVYPLVHMLQFADQLAIVQY